MGAKNIKIVLLLGLVVGCGDNYPADIPPDAQTTAVFHACEPGLECETGDCRALDIDETASVCSFECQSHADCQAVSPNAFCICDFDERGFCLRHHPPQEGDTPLHCLLPCHPEEDREYCDKYDIFCPSDCFEQGLACQVATFSLETGIRFACLPEV